MCPYSELFWSTFSRIFPHSDWIRRDTEYLWIRTLRISPYSVRMRENAGNLRTRMAPNTDIFTQWICMMFSTFNPYKKGKKKQVSDWKEKTNFWQNIMMWMVCINIFLEFLLIFKLMFNSDDSVTLLKVERQRHQMG